MTQAITTLSNWAIPLMILIIFAAGLVRRVNIYDAFIEGAAQGFKLAIDLIPYFLAMMALVFLLYLFPELATWLPGLLF